MHTNVDSIQPYIIDILEENGFNKYNFKKLTSESMAKHQKEKGIRKFPNQ